MRSKLHRIAQTFATKVGDDLERYTFVFPNRRAGLFFRKYLMQYIEKPMFSPRVTSINECFSELSDLEVTDQLTLLLHLYSEYKKLRPNAESLDRFIYWGKMMLADFSEIDNHLIPHVEALFASVTDIHNIEQHYAYLTDNQRRAIARFWTEFSQSDQLHPSGDMHQRFLYTWDLLYPLYTALREQLLSDGLVYEGLLHREVIEHWNEIPLERFREQYVFMGFNALTASERELMLRLQEMGRADFYFDYDSPFLCDPQNKASLFMEENLRLFKSRYDVSNHPEDIDKLDVTLISVPSAVGEAHEVHRILSEIIPSAPTDLTRTAIVLPDEQMLIPILNAFPKQVSKINVTMGYPLRATSLYMPVAYPEQFIIPMPETAEEFMEQMRTLLHDRLNDDTSEGVYQLTKVLDRLQAAIASYPQIAFTVVDMQQLLKMLTLETSIPYVGEPLDGLQVMGVLETRALDFDNVIITGFNDELYPSRTRGNSFVPYTLRHGFGLPTPERQDAIFAYNFYRMLSYAKRVWLLTNSAVDGMRSGEVSRYLHQLRLQYHQQIDEQVVTNQLVLLKEKECQPIVKDERVQQIRKLSPSALTTYLSCQKKFYYLSIEHYKEPEPDESVLVSASTIGTVFHAIMQQLYQPFIGKLVTASDVEQLLHYVNTSEYWSSLTPLQKLQGDPLTERVVQTYVRNILNHDYHVAPFQYIDSEKYVYAPLTVGDKTLVLHGIIDRVDKKADTIRVIDYKTGSVDLEYTTMDEVFGIVPIDGADEVSIRKSGKEKVLQTLLYCLFLSDQYTNIAPHLYPARTLKEDTDTAVWSSEIAMPLVWNNQLHQEFETALKILLEEIFNPNFPFHPTQDAKTCESCAFAQLCHS